MERRKGNKRCSWKLLKVDLAVASKFDYAFIIDKRAFGLSAGAKNIVTHSSNKKGLGSVSTAVTTNSGNVNTLFRNSLVIPRLSANSRRSSAF